MGKSKSKPDSPVDSGMSIAEMMTKEMMTKFAEYYQTAANSWKLADEVKSWHTLKVLPKVLPMSEFDPYPGLVYKKPSAFQRIHKEKAKVAATSQKIRGLQALKDYGYKTVRFTAVGKGEEQWVLPRHGVPLFVRPCPQRPVHGYLESVQLADTDVPKFLTKCRALDPEVEFLICEWIPAQWNGILTPGRLVIGPGHDGATAGKGAQDVPVRNCITMPAGMLRQAGVDVDEGEAPYFELVGHSASYYAQKTYLTQLRSGPKLQAGTDYVPESMQVRVVVEPQGEDLIAWAKRVATFKPGTVVYHEEGSLASHYGVHCVLHKVPYVVTQRPEIGKVIEPKEEVQAADLAAVLDGIRASEAFAQRTAYTRELNYRLLPIVLYALHENYWLTQNATGAFLLGVGLDLAARCGMMAVLGERRHRRNGKIRPAGPREQVYEKVFSAPEMYVRKTSASPRVFRAAGWGSSFGGASWASCAEFTRQLIVDLRRFTAKPTQEGLTAAVNSLNHVVTAAHNNGKFLNKFCDNGEDSGLFDHAARGDLAFYLQLTPAIASWLLEEPLTRTQSAWEKMGTTRKPRSRRKQKRLYKGCSVLVKLRDEGNTAHFQIGHPEHTKYRVANKPVAQLPSGFVEWMETLPMRDSFASSSQYYQVPVSPEGKLIGPRAEEYEIE